MVESGQHLQSCQGKIRQYNPTNLGYFMSLILHCNEACKSCSRDYVPSAHLLEILKVFGKWLFPLSLLGFPIQELESMSHDRQSKTICYLLCKSHFYLASFYTSANTLLSFLCTIIIKKLSSNNSVLFKHFSLTPTHFSEEKPNPKTSNPSNPSWSQNICLER